MFWIFVSFYYVPPLISRDWFSWSCAPKPSARKCKSNRDYENRSSLSHVLTGGLLH